MGRGRGRKVRKAQKRRERMALYKRRLKAFRLERGKGK
jgi:hypothetical protein